MTMKFHAFGLLVGLLCASCTKAFRHCKNYDIDLHTLLQSDLLTDSLIADVGAEILLDINGTLTSNIALFDSSVDVDAKVVVKFNYPASVHSIVFVDVLDVAEAWTEVLVEGGQKQLYAAAEVGDSAMVEIAIEHADVESLVASARVGLLNFTMCEVEQAPPCTTRNGYHEIDFDALLDLTLDLDAALNDIDVVIWIETENGILTAIDHKDIFRSYVEADIHARVFIEFKTPVTLHSVVYTDVLGLPTEAWAEVLFEGGQSELYAAADVDDQANAEVTVEHTNVETLIVDLGVSGRIQYLNFTACVAPTCTTQDEYHLLDLQSLAQLTLDVETSFDDLGVMVWADIEGDLISDTQNLLDSSLNVDAKVFIDFKFPVTIHAIVYEDVLGAPADAWAEVLVEGGKKELYAAAEIDDTAKAEITVGLPGVETLIANVGPSGRIRYLNYTMCEIKAAPTCATQKSCLSFRVRKIDQNVTCQPPAEFTEPSLGSNCPDGWGILLDLGLFVGGDLSIDSVVEGKTFVAGNLISNSSASFATKISATANTTLEIAGSIMAGSDIDITTGSVATGDIVTTSLLNLGLLDLDITSAFDLNGRKFLLHDSESTVNVDADARFKAALYIARIRDLSLYLHELTVSGHITTANITSKSKLLVDVNVTALCGVAVLHVDADLIFNNKNIRYIEILNNIDAELIIINVAGVTVDWNFAALIGTWFKGDEGRAKTIWNFYEALHIDFHSNEMMGAVIAPYAHVSAAADIHGATAVASLTTTASIRLPILSVPCPCGEGTTDSSGSLLSLDLNATLETELEAEASTLGCCSHNYKSCIGWDCGNTPETCGQCNSLDAYVWLDADLSAEVCKERFSNGCTRYLDGSSNCCPGLECKLSLLSSECIVS